MITVERLMKDHRELRACCIDLRTVAGASAPPADEVLTQARWRLARSLLRLLPLKDRALYPRLRKHADRAVAQAAERFSTEAATLYDQYLRYADAWTAEKIRADWTHYRGNLELLVNMLDDRLDREEAELFPYLDSAPEVEATRQPGDRNWAADGWVFRRKLGLD